MIRSSIVTVAVGLAVLVNAGQALAQQEAKKKKKTGEIAPASVTTIAGTITRVSDDGKTFSLTAVGGTKKAPAATTEHKITANTKVEYVGVQPSAERRLTAGDIVIVAFNAKDKELATEIKVAPGLPIAKKKKKTAQ